MNKYVDITFKDKSWIFNGSIETHRCSPTVRCGTCAGSGRCPDCNGQGEYRCDSCGGRGVLRCDVCGGGGVHDGKRCYYCSGSGTKDCSSCGGRGFVTCESCSGSGRCYNCGGSGAITCSRCQGTGYYQQYLEYTSHYCVRQFCYPGLKPELLEGLRLATGDDFYKAVCKLWSKKNSVAFDDTTKCLKQLCDASGEYVQQAEAFKKEYEATHEMQDDIQDYMPYKNTLTSSKIPVTRIVYEINGQEYVMYLLGDNGVVCYDDLPKKVKAFDMGRAEKREYNSYAWERHEELARLTAYIFNLDGINPEESKSLSLILKHMCLNAHERDKYVRYLKYRYTPEMPVETLFKKVKHLLMSKKTISYVWQCIALDHEISPKEQEFFDQLASCYQISESELAELKRYSGKFAAMDNDQFVKEYLDSEPVTSKNDDKLRWLIGVAIGVILFIIGFFVRGFLVTGLVIGVVSFLVFKFKPELTRKDIEKLYQKVSREPDLSYNKTNSGDFFLKLKANIGKAFDRLVGGK